MRWLLVAVAACAKPAPEPLHNVGAAKTRLVAIESTPALVIPRVAGAARDCRPSEMIRKRFAGRQVIACGALGPNAGKPALAAARTCIEHALADEQPFLLEAEVPGIDSRVVRALIGVIDRGALATYQVLFDSDPCGGSCPERGTFTLERCARLVTDLTNPDGCAADITRCFHCEGAHAAEYCRFGS